MTPDDLFAHNRDANSWSEGNPLVPSLANLSTSSLSGIPRCPGIHTKVTLSHLVLLALAYPHQSQFVDGFCKCCYCCPFIRADMYSRSRYVLRQGEICAPQDCHHFSLKHCRELPIGILSLWLSLSPYTPALEQLLFLPFRVPNANVGVADFTWHTPAFSSR